jgi:hypothetical protein
VWDPRCAEYNYYLRDELGLERSIGYDTCWVQMPVEEELPTVVERRPLDAAALGAYALFTASCMLLSYSVYLLISV